MQLTSTLATLILAASALASPVMNGKVVRDADIDARQGFKDFFISDIYINTYEHGQYNIDNRKIACKSPLTSSYLAFHFVYRVVYLTNTTTVYWNDANNKATTICSMNWHDPSTSKAKLPSGQPHPDTKPTGYINCSFNGKNDKFQWYFSEYKSMSDFQIQLKHSYKGSDPIKYPPPYDTVGLFATLDVKLQCNTGEGGQQGCYLPPGTKKLNAYINGATAK